jgi:hypothetical protein
MSKPRLTVITFLLFIYLLLVSEWRDDYNTTVTYFLSTL